MATSYKHKRSSTAGKVPVAADFEDGEILVNTADGRAFVQKGAGVETIRNTGDNDARYVRHDTASQGLNSTQQANARTNINAAPTNHTHDTRYIRHDTASQGLNSAQQSNALTNLGVSSFARALLDDADAAAARATLGAAQHIPPVGAVGSWAFAHNTAGDVTYGGSYPGSSLVPTGAATSIYIIATGYSANPSPGSALSGTWVCLGSGVRTSVTAGVGAVDYAHLYQRIA